MSSLQEQLLKAGLVDEDRLKQADKERRKRDSQSRKSAGKKAPKKQNAASAAAQKRKAEQRAREQALNEQRKQAASQKEIAAQVRQLVQDNRLDRAGGEIPYSFVYRKKIKKIFVNEAQKQQLADGKLAIATFVLTNEGRRFELVPMPVAKKIAERDAEAVVELSGQDEAGADADDPYADYKIPDDLTW
jgi:uncharacterized protein YaiL (DUF2058 family)